MKKRLKEVCEFYSGTGFPIKYQGDSYGDLPFYKVSDIANNEIMGNCFLDVCNNYISYDTVREIKGTVIPRNVVVFAKIGEALKLNRRCITSSDCLIDNNVMGIGCNEKYLDIKYFYFFMKNLKLEKLAESTTVPSVRKTKLEELFIEVPNMELQLEIARTLEVIQDIILYRQKQLIQMDKLIRARFVEMFGDPQINHFGWDVINISEVINGKVSNGFFAKRDDYVDDGNVSILGVSNIVNRMYSKIDGLPKTNANDKDIAKFEVKYGDMLFCRSSLVAEGIGKASIIPEDIQENVLFECHVIRLPLDLNKCVPEFMQTLSSMEYFRNQIIAQSKTATMTTIGQDGIIKTEIILPPINKQREYYQFIKEVNKSKLLSVSQPQIHIYKTLTLL